MWEAARWLKVPKEEIEEKKIYHGDMTGRFAYFRCEVEVKEYSSLTIDITANSRYRLWVNEKSVLSGPCKGDWFRQYYETVELTPYLRPGKNVFCVQVLYCDPETADRETDERASIYGVIGRGDGHRLAVEGDFHNGKGEVTGTITTGRADWKVWLEDSFYLKSTDVTCFLGAVVEEFNVSRSMAHWKERKFDISGWKSAKTAEKVILKDHLYLCGVEPKFRIREREIPLLYEKKDQFVRVLRNEYRAGWNTVENENKKDAEEWLEIDGVHSEIEEKDIVICPGETCELIFDAGVIKNGYPKYLFQEGKGAEVSITYFEKFGGQGSDLKRTDSKNGKIAGLTDRLVLDGKRYVYEPFWVRSFRFVCVRIVAKQEKVFMKIPEFKRTGYPLRVETTVQSSEPWVGKLWEMCVRTLENCMMETYMDCPGYEQLQFAMDTRLEALFTYTVTNDAALARKALLDFHYGMQPEGLTAGKYPSAYLQILSTFSLHYIYMIREYFQQTGDVETLRMCRGDVDRILEYYHARIGENGLVGRLEFWEFVDWQPDWAECGGTPRALQYGASTIINLMYAYALWCGIQIMEASGRSGLSEEYRQRREVLIRAIQRLCWDEEKGMYREGPEFRQFTRHAQAWAVLNGMAEGNKKKEILTHALADEECLSCSFSTSYEWFRALEKAGMYQEIRNALDEWIELIQLDCTTCPETPKGARSECHAWSALPMYEIIHTIAGIIPNGIQWNHVAIKPHLLEIKDLKGTACTPYGSISFQYTKKENGWEYKLGIPSGMKAVFYFKDGSTKELLSGEINYLSEYPE